MSNDLFSRILASAAAVDDRFARISDAELCAFQTSFPVPASHPRSADIDRYPFVCATAAAAFPEKQTFVLADVGLRSVTWIEDELPSDADVAWLAPSEAETKECGRLDAFYADRVAGKGYSDVVAVGGGIVINAASYVAEREGCALAYVPTTVLAMADAAIGGKVRANRVEDGACRKHAYKSWYEPDRVVLDPRFLDALPDAQISVGMGEIIKQGVYQSRPLLAFLASDAFDPFRDRAALLKSILWAVALAANCLGVDPEESPDGARLIMRGAHDASDKIEEASCFRVPHGIAVAQAIRQELEDQGSPLLPLVETCLTKFHIPFVSL
jgi:3-dehydroquinate synthetase